MSLQTKTSPMMAQWHSCKVKAKEALLLFRLGDFYEAFYEDAHTLARELNLTLTERHKVPMSGIPAHVLETHLEKLIAKGYLVAIAEQLEDPSSAKGLVKRAITRIVSPATHLESHLLKDKMNNFFASICQVNSRIGLCFLDLTTGEMFLIEVDDTQELIDEICRRSPTEILLSEKFYKKEESIFQSIKRSFPFRVTLKQEYIFDHKVAYNSLATHFKVHSLDALGLKGLVSAINAAGTLLNYMVEELNQSVSHVQSIKVDTLSSYMLIDQATMRHLDLLPRPNKEESLSLLEVIDHTQTPMGGRLLRNWLIHPLLSSQEIRKRLDGVEELVTSRDKYPIDLRKIRDLERLLTRIKTKRATPRDLLALSFSLEPLPHIYKMLEERKAAIFTQMLSARVDLEPIRDKIQRAIDPSPPTKITEGGVFKPGYCEALDELRALRQNSQDYLAHYQNELRIKLNIKTLKVSYNRAFGFFIEVSRGQSDKMPLGFERRQTLVNAERYISPELKEYEDKILHAEERMIELEGKYFADLVEEIGRGADAINLIAQHIAVLDCLYSLSHLAKEGGYIRPEIEVSSVLEIVKGRHPIIEASQKGVSFIPNDTFLSPADHHLMIITGPNMAGKSTYIRQVALIVILAQMGSFVPASKARIGIVDKVFSRIGAQDDLMRGQSTFMVEMTETANILNHATARSLVILDEIGRGTSTYDGIAIAWAVAQHLLVNTKANTLFATHYWELTKMQEEHSGVKNFFVAVQENEDGIFFLHKILQGETDKSYGIHVAKLAGLPPAVIKQAQKLLLELEKKKTKQKPAAMQKNEQFLLFPMPSHDNQVVEELRTVDTNKLTPLQALQMLAKWQNELRS